MWLTRKGAIDANEGVMGVIPGSMGTRSYVVRGKGNPAACIQHRTAPDAGSRARSARELFTADDLAKAMVGIEYRHGEAWVDEIPQAYKDIDVVMDDAAELVEVVAELRQVMNVKGSDHGTARDARPVRESVRRPQDRWCLLPGVVERLTWR